MEDGGWAGVCEVLRGSVGEDSFQRWFRAADWAGHEEGVGTVERSRRNPSGVGGDQLSAGAHGRGEPGLQRSARGAGAWSATRRSCRQPHSNGHRRDAPCEARPAAATLEGEALERRIKSSGLNPAHTFASFVVGANSQFAHAACEAVAKKDRHRLQSALHSWRPGPRQDPPDAGDRPGNPPPPPGSRVVYLTCEKFTNEFIDSVRRGDLEKFRRRYRSSDVLLIDDVQFLAGKERSQEEFFHTFNTLLDGRNQVVLTCDRPACEIKSLEPRLVSRFECGLTVEMQPPADGDPAGHPAEEIASTGRSRSMSPSSPSSPRKSAPTSAVSKAP